MLQAMLNADDIQIRPGRQVVATRDPVTGEH